MADVSSLLSGLLSLGESPKDIETVHFQAMAALSLEVGLTPLVEELGLDLLINIKPYKVLIFIVFMHEVHGMSIPSS